MRILNLGITYKFYGCQVVREPQSEPQTSKTAFTGDSKLHRDNAVDSSCTSEKREGSSLVNVTSQGSSTFRLPSHSTSQDVVASNIQSTSKKPVIFHSGLPTMVQYGQPTVFPGNAKVDQRITSQIQMQDEFPAWQSSRRNRPVSFLSNAVNPHSRLQSNFAGFQSNTTSFQSNVSMSDLARTQSYIVEPPSSLPRFQPKDLYARSPSASVQFNAADPYSRRALNFQSNLSETGLNLTGYKSVHGSHFNDVNVQSQFIQDNLNYFPRAQTAPCSVKRRNVEVDTANIGQHNQSLTPFYMGGITYKNAVYHSKLSPGYFAMQSPITSATPDFQVCVPPERLGTAHISGTFSSGSQNVFCPNNAPMVSTNLGREMIYSDHTSQLWSNVYTTEEIKMMQRPRSSSLLTPPGMESVSTEYNSNFWPNVSTRSAYCFPDYDHKVTTRTLAEPPSSITLNSFLSSETKLEDSYQNINSIKQEHRSSCRFVDSPHKNTSRDIFASSGDIQSYPQRDSPEDISPEKFFSEALSTFSAPTHSTRHTWATNLEDTMKVIGFPSCVLAPLPPLMSTTDVVHPIYTIPPANQTKSTFICTPTYPTPSPYPISPIAHHTAYAYPIHGAQPASLTGSAYVKSSTSQVFDKSSKQNLTELPHSSCSGLAFDGKTREYSDLVKCPLTREGRKRNILSVVGLNNLETSSSSCKISKETCQENKKKTKSVQNSSCSTSSNNIGGDLSGCVVSGNSVTALSPTVVKAATILSNSSMQRWKTLNKLNSSVKRSSLNETSTSQSMTEKPGQVYASQLQNDEMGKEEKGSGLQACKNQTVTSSCSSSLQKNTESADQEKKDAKNTSFPQYEEVTFHNVSSTHKTVAIQVQSDTKKLRRPRICIPQQSTACQTQQLTPDNTTTFVSKDLLAEEGGGKSLRCNEVINEFEFELETTDQSRVELKFVDDDGVVSLF